jgi:hypothetical protein
LACRHLILVVNDRTIRTISSVVAHSIPANRKESKLRRTSLETLDLTVAYRALAWMRHPGSSGGGNRA